MPSPSQIPEEISLYSQEFQGDYNFANMQQVFLQIIHQTRDTLELESNPYKKKNLLRVESGINRLLHDFGEELTNIRTNPLFSDEQVNSVLQEAQNFPLEKLEDFFQNFVTDKDIQELYTTKLPIEFDLLAGLNNEQLEFVKQRCLRGLGEDSKSDIRRGFLLQVIRYMGYGYDKHHPKGQKSIFGIRMSEFSQDFSIKAPSISHQLAGATVVGNVSIMQLIDAIHFFNNYNHLDGFKRRKQSLYLGSKVTTSIDNSGAMETFARGYRADVLSQKGVDIFSTPLNEIGDESLYEIYTSIVAYTGENHDKIKKILIYISDYLGYKMGSSKIGFNYNQLAQNTGVTKQLFDMAFNRKDRNPRRLILRALVAVSDFNNGRDEFSQEVFEDVRKQVKEERV